MTTASRPLPASVVAFDGELSPTLRPPELTDRGELGELGPVAPNLGLSFSRDIVALAERALSEGHVPRSDHHSNFDDRTRLQHSRAGCSDRRHRVSLSLACSCGRAT